MIANGNRYIHRNREASKAQLVSHLKYIEHRNHKHSQETHDDHRIFSKDHDVVNRRDAAHHIMEHTNPSVKFHKIVLSLGEDESISNWCTWTRLVMRDLGKAQGKELYWYAVYHSDTIHPHTHIVVASAGYNRAKGCDEPVTFHTKDYRLLRELGRKHSNHDFHHLIEAQFQELNTLDHTLDREYDTQHIEYEPISFSLEDVER